MIAVVRKLRKIFQGSKSVNKLGDLSRISIQASTPNKYRTHMCGEITEQDVGKSVKLSGWLEYNRGGKIFTLTDHTGSCQVIQDTIDVKLPRLNSVLQVEGQVIKRPEGQVNKSMKTGRFEIQGCKIEILNESRALPITMSKKVKEANEEVRMRYRYLDLRSKKLQENLRLRSSFILNIRKHLCENQRFVDVETPTLFRKTPGGAREFIVPTRIPGAFYSLPQSPQQFKQLLMASGIDRYLQVAKCYRDESVRSDRQPEFTQLDLELSYTTQEEVKNIVEETLSKCWPSDLPALQLPFPRMSYNEAMLKYGTDKPDTRFDCHLVDVTTELGQVTLFKQILSHQDLTVRACNIPNASNILSKTQIGKLQQSIESMVKMSIATVIVADESVWKSPLVKFIHSDSTISAVNEKLNAKPGDLIFISAHTDTAKVCDALGRCRKLATAHCAETYQPLYRENMFNFLWVEDFPLFELDDGHLTSAHHPFTAPVELDIPLLYDTPLKVRGQHYDLVLNGYEVGGGSIRIHNSQLQKRILNDILKVDSSSLQHLLDALAFGCPPHGGIALGLDRLLAIICNSNSIRDVIAFPKSIEGRDLTCGAPCDASQDDLNFYHISTKIPQEKKIMSKKNE